MKIYDEPTTEHIEEQGYYTHVSGGFKSMNLNVPQRILHQLGVQPGDKVQWITSTDPETNEQIVTIKKQ